MSSWELLHEIRSIDSDSGVETAHRKLLKYVKEEAARHPSLTHNLCQCSMLCGAFCRKLASLDVSIVTDAIRYVDSLLLALKNVVPSSMESTIFAYAFGEIETFRRMRNVTCRHRIDDLTRSIPAFRWDIEKITTALRELSTTEESTEKTQSLIGRKKRPREENDVSGTGLAPVAVRWRLPLRDPISMSVVTIPVRGLSCQHQEVFDLGTFVCATQQIVTRRAESIDGAAGQKWEDGGSGSGLHSAACPVCGKATPLHSLRVDEQIMETMKQYTQKGNVLSAGDFIVWDASTSTYCIEERPSGAHESEEKVDEMQEKEPSRPKRVVHIEGHVLYADD
ncbi:zinc finger protein [Trypanosoma melophagium]|uniref:zinc finger protein n=1 Tax=Trypanosoma melophagium TaxID=715481 RepID=UPI00351A9772|nr:zinc finger protein [Trypanosoma melophagium]